MHESEIRNKALREKKEIERQVNNLILDYEERWNQQFGNISLIPISTIKNNLPYDQQKGGRIQLFLNS
ncbi:hypothetical protein [Pedobacter aquatilis]|uniref:hypothetical protein n=1 Tax=Pedobacter aquatilis TaxID=351343 RepID=UPI00292CD063|nr:hypothetical protein [Pedobacter aquatilis]